MAIYHITIKKGDEIAHKERLDSYQIPLGNRMEQLEKQYPKDKGYKIDVLKEDPEENKEEWDWLA